MYLRLSCKSISALPYWSSHDFCLLSWSGLYSSLCSPSLIIRSCALLFSRPNHFSVTLYIFLYSLRSEDMFYFLIFQHSVFSIRRANSVFFRLANSPYYLSFRPPQFIYLHIYRKTYRFRAHIKCVTGAHIKECSSNVKTWNFCFPTSVFIFNKCLVSPIFSFLRFVYNL